MNSDMQYVMHTHKQRLYIYIVYGNKIYDKKIYNNKYIIYDI